MNSGGSTPVPGTNTLRTVQRTASHTPGSGACRQDAHSLGGAGRTKAGRRRMTISRDVLYA